MSKVRFVASYPYTPLQKKLALIVGDKEVRRLAHEILGEMCEPYVPKDTGGLRNSMKSDSRSVRWNTPYARYQYYGEVYGPNVPIIRNEIIEGWYTPKGAKKYPTGRELGVPGNYKGWVFGYTEPGTGHHWFEKAMAGGGRIRYGKKLTYELRKAVKRMGL